jgi:hypothetical protein
MMAGVKLCNVLALLTQRSEATMWGSLLETGGHMED